MVHTLRCCTWLLYVRTTLTCSSKPTNSTLLWQLTCWILNDFAWNWPLRRIPLYIRRAQMWWESNRWTPLSDQNILPITCDLISIASSHSCTELSRSRDRLRREFVQATWLTCQMIIVSFYFCCQIFTFDLFRL